MDDKISLIVLIVLIVAMVAFLAWGVYTGIIFANNKLYCKHHLRKEWDMWEKGNRKIKGA